MDRNWRVFMTVANSSAPYVRIVCMMNSWPACTAPHGQRCSACRGVDRSSYLSGFATDGRSSEHQQCPSSFCTQLCLWTGIA